MIRSSAPVVAQDRVNLPLRFFAGVLLTLALALALFALLMRPPFADLRAMTLFLSITAVISLAAGTAAYRLGWLERSPSVAWTLVAIYGLASLLTFINVWVTARLMFASQHDLLLATVLLLFAGGIAMALSSFLSADLARRMRILSDAAGAVAAGQLATHVEVTGHDELAALGRSFNAMSEQLEQSARRQQALEIQRRDLIAWAGHDLRTPLASVRAIIEALADGVVDDHAGMERYLRTAQREVQSLSALIDDLFELAQLDAGGLQLVRRPVALGDLVSDTLESFAALAREARRRVGGPPAGWQRHRRGGRGKDRTRVGESGGQRHPLFAARHAGRGVPAARRAGSDPARVRFRPGDRARGSEPDLRTLLPRRKIA